MSHFHSQHQIYIARTLHQSCCWSILQRIRCDLTNPLSKNSRVLIKRCPEDWSSSLITCGIDQYVIRRTLQPCWVQIESMLSTDEWSWEKSSNMKLALVTRWYTKLQMVKTRFHSHLIEDPYNSGTSRTTSHVSRLGNKFYCWSYSNGSAVYEKILVRNIWLLLMWKEGASLGAATRTSLLEKPTHCLLDLSTGLISSKCQSVYQ